MKYCTVGVSVSICLSLIVAIFGDPVASWFSDDEETRGLIAQLLIVWVFLEPGRAINLTVIFGLKGAGGVLFPVQVGVVFMWGVGVLLAYLLGIHWAFGLVGIWIAVDLDEWTRGLTMVARWRSERWIAKSTIAVPAI